MDKRQLHHKLVVLHRVSPIYFVIIALIFGVISVFAMRNNNLVALKLRDEVVQTDEKNGDVETALRNLRQHIYSHMKTDLSYEGGVQQPVQLKYRYERLVRAEQERVSKLNEKVYTDAQTECERLIPVGRIANRVPCVQEYVAKNTVTAQPIPDSLYKFDFQPPVWSPDLAGISLLVSALSGVIAVILFSFKFWLGYRLKARL